MKKILTATVLAASCFFANTAFAGDTNEVLDQNTLEIAPAFTLDNIHAGNPSIGAEIGVGYGVLEEFTVGAALWTATEEAFDTASFGFGIYTVYTPYDSDHFDLDILMDFSYDSEEYVWTPGIELNYDFEPDQASWGLYTRINLPVYSVDRESDEEDIKTDFGLDFTLGLYLTFAEIHQVLFEGGFTVENLAGMGGETSLISNPLSVGYNVVLRDNFELTTEVAFYIPNIGESAEEFAAAITVGGLFSIGSAPEAAEETAEETAE